MYDGNLETTYRGYIDCLNGQSWCKLGRFVSRDVCHNERVLGLEGYASMLADTFSRIPDLRFHISLVVADDTMLAARLLFDCTPIGDLLGLPVNGRRVSFSENVLYRFEGGRIKEVWSIIDRPTIEAQISHAWPVA